ncbi:hypothetical protein F4802DRAFT_65648 [Xylaria palmicola]|nr:hypothetical protein F4802DRAFT_65648 [Xylaria palmicola]
MASAYPSACVPGLLHVCAGPFDYNAMANGTIRQNTVVRGSPPLAIRARLGLRKHHARHPTSPSTCSTCSTGPWATWMRRLAREHPQQAPGDGDGEAPRRASFIGSRSSKHVDAKHVRVESQLDVSLQHLLISCSPPIVGLIGISPSLLFQPGQRGLGHLDFIFCRLLFSCTSEALGPLCP